ncbi:phenylalanine-4-hydroxylase [Psychroflexus sediminis]|uniref:Phenylalanine 4-hydroxylase n=1 Tax=Psychroflexus sediminis TaxID=470826 RepID=A0A1G7U011_9FLAO|nr:phenylalanine-4-hydroxylase [Psychroflexus sediminis]SDG40872.1 Phenylalanine 4-hydroxylase [Psychroflexus sediminis]
MQDMSKYTQEDLWVWRTLFTRQKENIPGKSSQAYTDALEHMSPVLNAEEIPNFKKINTWFENETKWKLEVVPGLIPVQDFFQLLAQRKFCSSIWLRSKDSLDYLEEPDMFHDIFGHVPLLSNPIFSEFVHEFGKLGCQFLDDTEKLLQLQRLYWFSIEFGVIQEQGKIQSYGAGILSSYSETIQIHEQKANFLDYSIEAIIQKAFRTDIMQEDYYVISSFEMLFESLKKLSLVWNKELTEV